ncbi:MAG TPA: acyl-CoA desaturase [Pseudonocardiaceae bacterium]
MTITLPAPPPPNTGSASDFAPLVAQIREHGLMRRRRGRYALMIGTHLALIGGLGAAMVALGPSWWQLALAPVAAVLFARTGFIGHDAGHKQIARTHRVNRLIGLLHGNLLIGMSYGWWVDKHNRHHANPNDAERDPDVATGVVVWTPEQAVGRRGIAAWMARNQAKVFFPLLLLESLHLTGASWRDIWRRRAVGDAALLATHLAGYVTFLLVVMSPAQALAFAVLHHALFGLHLGLAFAPNHKGMPMPKPGERWSHLRRQVLTSRNVRGGVVTDWLLGGLNYQIEHHLFPSMPRPSLRHAQPLVRAYCAQVGLPYTEESAAGSYRAALRYLDSVA